MIHLLFPHNISMNGRAWKNRKKRKNRMKRKLLNSLKKN